MTEHHAQEVVRRVGSRGQLANHGAPLTPTTRQEEDLVLASLAAATPSIGAIVGRDCEVVVHDLRQPERSIVALVNGHVSGRCVGGPLIGGPMNDMAMKALVRGTDPDPEVLSYETKTADGRTLKSSTTLYYNAELAPFAALCLNHDLSAPMAAAAWLKQLMGESQRPTQVEPSANGDFTAVLANLIAESLAQEPTPLEELDREARLRIVSDLEARGAFLIRGSVVKVAEALGISKFTVYAYLDTIRATT